jgi:hypothetical protein
LVARTSQRSEAAGHHHYFVERRVGSLNKPAGEPPQRVPLAAGPISNRDQRSQLERLAELQRAGTPRLDFGDDEVAALNGPAECCSRVSVVAQVASVLGPDPASLAR